MPEGAAADEAGAAPWQATVLTLFPEAFPGPLGLSLAGKGLDRDIWRLATVDIRDFATDRHRSVDDTPMGGGAGMVMRPDVVDRAIQASDAAPGPLIYLSPRGRPFDRQVARELADGPGVRLLCGRYEGVDQRVLDKHGVAEISLGDYVLSGGEMAALVVLDATVRLLPGVMGNAASPEEESFERGLLEYPQYTRPAVWEGRAVPEVLLSGHHAQIRAWRRGQAEAITRARRPDLWARYTASGRSGGDETD
jgi:tRNA (guanine37-N1)-methyltransferase